MSTVDHQVCGWFEIPVKDMVRAIKFYESVMDKKLERHELGNLDMAWFPYATDPMAPGAGGSLVCNKEFYSPYNNGTMVYLTAWSGDVSIELGRVEAAGGKVLVYKTQISEEHGYMGVILDTEGNRVGFYSRG